jgi:hypothetical protein
MPPRTPWLDSASDELLARLAASGVTAPVDALKELIHRQVATTARSMGISESTARRYFDADLMASTMMEGIQGEDPGADLTVAPRSSMGTGFRRVVLGGVHARVLCRPCRAEPARRSRPAPDGRISGLRRAAAERALGTSWHHWGLLLDT